MVASAVANPLAFLKNWSRRPHLDWSLGILLIAAAACGVAGAKLLVMIPEDVFRWFVPPLLAMAVLMVRYSRFISTWVVDSLGQLGASARGGNRSPIDLSLVRLILFIPVAIYGGFFGAGLGVLVLGVLSIGAAGDVRAANVTKNLLNSVTCLTSAIVLAMESAVSWDQTKWMLLGNAIGGLLGGWFSGNVDGNQLRLWVVRIGIVVTILYTCRYWLGYTF